MRQHGNPENRYCSICGAERVRIFRGRRANWPVWRYPTLLVCPRCDLLPREVPNA